MFLVILTRNNVFGFNSAWVYDCPYERITLQTAKASNAFVEIIILRDFKSESFLIQSRE